MEIKDNVETILFRPIESLQQVGPSTWVVRIDGSSVVCIGGRYGDRPIAYLHSAAVSMYYTRRGVSEISPYVVQPCGLDCCKVILCDPGRPMILENRQRNVWANILT